MGQRQNEILNVTIHIIYNTAGMSLHTKIQRELQYTVK